MSCSQYDRVRFDFAGHDLVGDVVEYLPYGTLAGPNGRLVVDVDGATYRVAEADAESLT